MFEHATEEMKTHSMAIPGTISSDSEVRQDSIRPAVVHFSSTPLFRLEKCPEKYSHLLKKKDLKNMLPIVNYFISHSGHIAYLGGDVVSNLYLRGRRKNYKSINILAILNSAEIDKYSAIMNNIISSNDGEFSLGLKYKVRKNRDKGQFMDLAHARYIIDLRLESIEKLLFPFRPAPIELDLTSQDRFNLFFGAPEA